MGNQFFLSVLKRKSGSELYDLEDTSYENFKIGEPHTADVFENGWSVIVPSVMFDVQIINRSGLSSVMASNTSFQW